MSCLRLIADDLTGALDSAAQFTGALGPLPVLTKPDVAQPPGSFVLNLSCRDGTAVEAIALSRRTVPSFRGADIAYKKIDSLLRGHWAAELAAILATGIFQRVILAPAFPAQGRFTIDGIQVIAKPGGLFERIGDPMAALSSHGIGRDGGQTDRTEVILADARSDADLSKVVSRFRDAPCTLWCGAAGLAQALAGKPAVPIRRESAPHLVVVGSHHPVTLDQINRFAASFPGCIVRFRSDGVAGAEAIQEVMRARGTCIAIPDIPLGQSPLDAALLIDDWIGTLTRHLAAPAVLTVVGGETFASCCRHLGADTLSVEGECEPGIPASRMTIGLWRGTLCFSKSGAFGSPDWLLHHTGASRTALN